MTTVRATGRWRGIVVVALAAVAVGVLADRPAILLVGAVGAGFVAYPRLRGPPPVALELERHVEDASPERGASVTVTTQLRNTGERTLADLRIVDGVPSLLTVADGSPRHSAVLRPGQSTSFRYAIDAQQGRHQFEPATVIARDITGAHEVETTVSAETEIACADGVPSVPVHQRTDGYAGRLVTDDGGSGIDFHSVREYRPGDPVSRIDSKRWARTGELSTVEFHEQRPTSVVLVLDARAPAYRARAEETPNAVAHGHTATQQLLSAFENGRDRVGLAVFGRTFHWHAPGVGPDHGRALRACLGAVPTQQPSTDERGDSDRQTERLRELLESGTQLLVCSPVTDDWIIDTVRTLSADGYPTTVVSPDMTADETVGQRLAVAERRVRIRALRDAGVPVVDWEPTTPLGAVLASEQRRRWSA